MPGVYPSDETIRVAIGLAQRAPSVHNSQPWRWRAGGELQDLHADPAASDRDRSATAVPGAQLRCGPASSARRAGHTRLGGRGRSAAESERSRSSGPAAAEPAATHRHRYRADRGDDASAQRSASIRCASRCVKSSAAEAIRRRWSAWACRRAARRCRRRRVVVARMWCGSRACVRPFVREVRGRPAGPRRSRRRTGTGPTCR